MNPPLHIRAKDRARRVLLGLLARIPFRPQTGAKDRILLIRPDHLGDVLFTTPALRLLADALPKANITYLVGPWSWEVAAHNNNLHHVQTCAFPGFTRRPKTSLLAPYLQLFREARRLRSLAFGCAINLRYDFWWGAALIYLAGIPQRMGYDLPLCRPFLSHPIAYRHGQHEVEQNLSLVAQGLGLEPTESPSLEFWTTPHEEAFASQWLGSHSAPLVAIHPGSGAPVKQWPLPTFARLADRLAQSHSSTIIITGSAAEAGLVRAVGEAMQNPFRPLVGASLGQLAAVLRRCQLVVGVDSGVLHLAVAMGTPTVHLYGPVSAATFGPWGEKGRHLVITSNMPCVPCDRLDYSPQEVKDHPCVTSIGLEPVAAAAESLLKG